jgi:sugar/nucleoside kinase (ribokinase family)
MILELATGIRERLGIHICVVHPTRFAVAASASEARLVNGPYIAKPKISTGAGDHFNAGFCCGHLIGCDLTQSLQMGVATSGYYVREGASPDRAQLIEFLRSL